jgi:hypothetical protein
MALSTEAKVGIWAIVVAIIIGVSALFIPEFREFLGLEKPSNLVEKEKTNNKTNKEFDTEEYSEISKDYASEFTGEIIIGTGFDLSVFENRTYVEFPIKLKQQDDKETNLCISNESYFTIPDGTRYDRITRDSERGDYDSIKKCHYSYVLKQSETYRKQMVFDALKSKPSYIIFHFQNNNLPPVKLLLNWTN